MPRGNFELKNPETGVAPKHREAALRGKGNSISNAGVEPAIKFKDSMYIGYTTKSGYPEFMEIEMNISNAKGKNEISMSGNEGEIMKTSLLEEKVEEYWENIDLEDEFGYVADESIGKEPSDEDIEEEMMPGTPTMEDDESAYVDAYDEAYNKAVVKHQEKREEYLEGIKNDLMGEGYYPWEYHSEQYINETSYTLTLSGCRQVLDGARNYTPVIPAEDLEFIIRAWEKHHFFGAFGNDEKTERSAPSIETMQRLIRIYKEYEDRGGDEAHIEKIVNATGI